MKPEMREQARRLRTEGVSVREIARSLGVSKGSVSLWVRDVQLTTEQLDALKANQRRYGGQLAGSQANRRKHLARRRAFQQAGRERAKAGSSLHMMGCMLYWAEGAKRRNEIYFVNSDPNMLALFTRFLREELRVDSLLITLHIHCHTDEPDEMKRIERYWLDLLRLPETCLRKTQTKKGSNTRRNILVNGVCGIRVSSTELVQHIYGAIQEYGGFENPDWLF